ncbi:unnamed protein product [Arctogadus glacialis]
MHVDILYNILQKRTTDPLKTRQALENFSTSIADLKDKQTTDSTQPQLMLQQGRTEHRALIMFKTSFPKKQLDVACACDVHVNISR